MQNRLKEKYQTEIKGKMREEFKYSSDLAVPKINKIVINVGSADMKDSDDLVERIKSNLSVMTGQKPVVTKAKKSISTFKLTKGQSIGLMVTLRGEKMYSFLDKLISAVLPKVRDFRGVPDKSFDESGNYNLGLREQMIFPEVEALATSTGFKGTDKVRGLQITINSTAKSKEEGKRLLELMGMPFQKA